MKVKTLSILALAGLIGAQVATPVLVGAQESAAREEMQSNQTPKTVRSANRPSIYIAPPETRPRMPR